MELDIVLLPPKSISQKLGDIMKKLSKNFDFWFVVDNRKLKPHLSLLHLKANSKRIKKISTAVKEIAEHRKAIKMQQTDFHIGKKFIVAGLTFPKQLYRLHENVVNEISQYRNGVVDLPHGHKTAKQKEYLKVYGVGNILEFYRPHITLGWLKSTEDLPKVLKQLSRTKLPKFKMERLAVTQVNKHHQVIKIIEEFKLFN